MAKRLSGVAPKTQEEKSLVLNVDSSPDFLYKFHPHRWALFGKKLLPVLGRLKLEPGIANIGTKKETEVAIASALKEGWKIIDAKHGPKDDNGRASYVRAYPGKKGAVHLTAFEDVSVVGNRVSIKANEEAYQAWLENLIEKKVIDKVEPEVVDSMIDFQEKKIADFSAKDLTKPLYKKMLDRAEEELLVLQEIRQQLEAA